MAEWWEDETSFAGEPTPTTSPPADTTGELAEPKEWWEEAGALSESEEMERTPFPMEPGTSRAAEELPELTDIGGFLPEAGVGEKFSQAWLNMTTLDQNELAQQLSNRFPNVGVQWAPDGTVIVANNETGKKVAVNKPGMSMMDALQAVGIIGAYSPASRITGAVTGIGKRIATGMATAGATEAGLQAQQELAGGEFDVADVGLATALGGAGDILMRPVAAAAQTVKSAFGRFDDLVPGSISKAIDFAKAQGVKITSSDALQEYLTAPMQIFVRVAERIPFVGLGGQRVKQQGARAETLTQLAKKYEIDVESEFGEEILESFVDRLVKKRFWGKNKNPTQAQIEKAFEREGDEITDSILQRYIRKGNIDEAVVDKTLDSGRPARIRALFDRLDERGQTAAKQRFMARALDDAGWTPEGPQFADANKFVKYLDDIKNRKALNTMFTPDERDAIEGAKEFLRLTEQAQKSGKGAGMTAAMATGAGFYFMDMLSASVLGLGTAATARALQSDTMRNLLLRLAHAKPGSEAIEKTLTTLRPMFIAAGEQVLQSDEPQGFDTEITEEMIKEKDEPATYEGTLDYLRNLGIETMEGATDIGARLQEMVMETAPPEEDVQ